MREGQFERVKAGSDYGKRKSSLGNARLELVFKVCEDLQHRSNSGKRCKISRYARVGEQCRPDKGDTAKWGKPCA